MILGLSYFQVLPTCRFSSAGTVSFRLKSTSNCSRSSRSKQPYRSSRICPFPKSPLLIGKIYEEALTRFCQQKGKEPVMAVSFDLQDFILRARVLKLYRQALRTARRAPIHARAELRQAIRQEMENNRNCNDKQRIRFLISEALERLKGLSEMFDMQGHS